MRGNGNFLQRVLFSLADGSSMGDRDQSVAHRRWNQKSPNTRTDPADAVNIRETGKSKIQDLIIIKRHPLSSGNVVSPEPGNKHKEVPDGSIRRDRSSFNQ